ncbi:unnamed protein product [Gemmata massiliana]|uniref:Uncharacterized protein n=1 Tax=Gemmata massiliana TaxID=1210884 RepID=A0A6P2CZF2_9BACT|nr:hypothetical protein [Gemmata massiliana]VTR92542.1 unnamed protein product [Gemmata massiliana]
MSNIDDVLRKALVSAYSLGTGANPAQETATATKLLNEKVEHIYNEFKLIKTAIKELPAGIAQAIKDTPGKIGDKAADAIAGPLVDAQDYLQRARDQVEGWTRQNFSFGQ